jgi:NADP-dependent 3-hydroxy acid dehydrogenase YdfG
MADLERLFKQIEQEKGKLDIVFANAGVAEYAPFGKVDEAQFDRLFDSNVKGMLFSVQKALPLMPDGGTIVLTGSVVGSKGFQANTVYAATKAAVRSFAVPEGHSPEAESRNQETRIAKRCVFHDALQLLITFADATQTMPKRE